MDPLAQAMAAIQWDGETHKEEKAQMVHPAPALPSEAPSLGKKPRVRPLQLEQGSLSTLYCPLIHCQAMVPVHGGTPKEAAKTMKKHIKKCHGGKDNPRYSCPLCGDKFILQTNLELHGIDAHDGQDMCGYGGPPRVGCPVCQEPFWTGEAMESHKFQEHSKPKKVLRKVSTDACPPPREKREATPKITRFPCPTCDSFHYSLNEAKKHLARCPGRASWNNVVPASTARQNLGSSQSIEVQPTQRDTPAHPNQATVPFVPVSGIGTSQFFPGAWSSGTNNCNTQRASLEEQTDLELAQERDNLAFIERVLQEQRERDRYEHDKTKSLAILRKEGKSDLAQPVMETPIFSELSMVVASEVEIESSSSSSCLNMPLIDDGSNTLPAALPYKSTSFLL